MLQVPQMVRCKIGISYDDQKRARQISPTIKGRVVPLFAVRVKFAEAWEGALHFVFGLFRAPIKGNGGSEFFWSIVIIPAMVLMIAIKVIDLLWPLLIVWLVWWIFN